MKYVIEDTTLQAVAESVRHKKKTTNNIKVSELADEILTIESGIDTSDATATVNDILKDKTAYADGQKITGTLEIPEPNLQDKSIEITENGLTIVEPDEGYDGLNTVNIITNVEGTDTTGEYYVKVVDYDGTILKEANLNEGDIFEMPEAPSHEGLIFDDWSSSQEIINNTITIINDNVIVGPIYHTESGACEFDIELTKVIGLNFEMSNLTGMTEIDWGDGIIDNNLSHTYSDYGKYTIKVYGVTSFSGHCIVSEYYNTLISCRLSNIVSSIGNDTFRSCGFLKSITISKNVSRIGTYAFYQCRSLPNIIIPEGVSTINTYAFCQCYSLTNIVIPKSVSSINTYAFAYCYSLTNIVIPESVSSISTYIFAYCYTLTNIRLPENISVIANYICDYCYTLTNIVIPENVSSVGNGAFRYCYLLKYCNFTKLKSIPKLSNTNAFQYINNDILKIIVPDELYDDWIIATNWSTYADCIYKASEVLV